MIKYLPSVFTAGNLICGFLAIIVSDFFASSILLLIGLVFDAVDGILARALNAQSEVGKELDSLADMVSFGVAPAFFYSLLSPSGHWSHYIPPLFLITGSAVRLAIFNTKESSKHFIGMPTPAVATFIIGLVLGVYYEQDFITSVLQNEFLYYFIPFVMMLLMLSNFRMFSLKAILTKGIRNQLLPALLILGCLILLIANHTIALSGSIIIYLVLSLIDNLLLKDE